MEDVEGGGEAALQNLPLHCKRSAEEASSSSRRLNCQLPKSSPIPTKHIDGPCRQNLPVSRQSQAALSCPAKGQPRGAQLFWNQKAARPACFPGPPSPFFPWPPTATTKPTTSPPWEGLCFRKPFGEEPRGRGAHHVPPLNNRQKRNDFYYFRLRDTHPIPRKRDDAIFMTARSQPRIPEAPQGPAFLHH